MANGEITYDEQSLHFPQCFKKSSAEDGQISSANWKELTILIVDQVLMHLELIVTVYS